MLKILFSNKIIVYVASRYATYALQFFVSMVIAAKLGPYYLGIYGFVNLIIGYLGQVNFGIPHSLNVLIVHNKNDELKCGSYIANSLMLYLFLSLIVLVLYVIVRMFHVQINENYPIDNYLFLITLIAILVYINSVLTAVLRVKGKINQLSLVQSISVLLNLSVVFLYSGEDLIMALVFCNLLSNVLVTIISVSSKILPNLSQIRINIAEQKEILYKGFYLFLYNSCFFFIILSIRTIVSSFYEVEDFGAFTFSFTLANAVMLLLNSILTIIFPKLLDLLSTNDHELIEQTLEKTRIGYISVSHLMIYFALLFFPLIVYLMPKYANAIVSMNLISLTVLMNTNACGYSSLLIAQNKEKISANISLLALLINVTLGLFFAIIIRVDYSYVIVSTLFTYMFFSFMCVWKGKTILGRPSIQYALKNFFPIKLLIPYMAAFIICSLKLECLIWLPLMFFVFFNGRDLIKIKQMAFKIINNPNITDI